MSIKTRLERLEAALPERKGDLRILCKSIVRRDGNGLLWEKPFLVMLVRQPSASIETIQRHESEGQAAFFARVRNTIRQNDAAEAEAFNWKPQPDTDHTE